MHDKWTRDIKSWTSLYYFPYAIISYKYNLEVLSYSKQKTRNKPCNLFFWTSILWYELNILNHYTSMWDSCFLRPFEQCLKKLKLINNNFCITCPTLAYETIANFPVISFIHVIEIQGFETRTNFIDFVFPCLW